MDPNFLIEQQAILAYYAYVHTVRFTVQVDLQKLIAEYLSHMARHECTMTIRSP